MAAPTLLDELAVYGPAAKAVPVSRAEAEAYCRRLAQSHYENFSVASWLLPRPLRQHFYHLYAYSRWADDLADETGSATQSLDLLAWWEAELDRCYAGHATHPVFIALRETIDTFDLPATPLRELLVAFRRDQVQTRYATYAELLDYCRSSANPVGHLVLCLSRADRDETRHWSDCICTGLQLANHWQDVARDYACGRIYLPLEDCERFGVTEAMLGEPLANRQVRALIAFEVERAEKLLLTGRPLIEAVDHDLRRQVHLFMHGGLAILGAIRRRQYDVLSRRPTLSKWQKARLVWRAWRHGGRQ